MDKDLATFLDDKYISKNKIFHPHKYILLSVANLYDENPYRDNRFPVDELITIFNKNFMSITNIQLISTNIIEHPFFHLKSNNFWFLKIKPGEEHHYHDIIKNYRSRFTLKRIRSIIEYAYLSEAVHSNLQNSLIRKKIVEKIKNLCTIYLKLDTKGVQNTLPLPQHSSTACKNFISYLNTLQRIHGGNENVLAEFQAQNPLFARIAVPHPLEKDIIQDLREGSHTIILTGHAGDGKTTLAFAVYRALCGLPPDRPLPQLGQSRVHFSFDGHKALLIKDLSEQARSDHAELMRALLDGGTRSLLVSNTGALLEFFLSQEPDISRHVELENTLLGSLSKERDDSFSFKGRPFKVYNLALRDNLPLAEAVLANMLAPDLWASCDTCQHRSQCPILFNRTLLADESSPARQRLFLAYRRLQAYGTRLTMRQLSEHLAYCLTGGLDEQELCRATILSPKSDTYHLYNLFFGGPQAKPRPEVAEMAAIRAIQQQHLGAHPLPCMDKKLWHVLPADATALGISPQALPFFQQLMRLGSTQKDPLASAEARLQARRLLYFCAAPPETALAERLQKEFLRSPGVLLQAGLYAQAQLDQTTKRHLLACLFHVLQEHFTGIHLPIATHQRGRDTLYITLNRPSPLLRQSVQTVLCAVSWQENFDLRVQERPDGARYLSLEGRRNLRDITPLELTVPFLDYVLRRYGGEVGELPRATFGQQLDTLKAQIIHCMREDEDPQSMRLLRYCSDYSLVQDEYILNKDMLEVIRGTH